MKALNKSDQQSIKTLSVIIVSYNTKQYLLDCIKSISENTFGINKEIIVVDNASSDGSSESVEIHFPEVIIINNTENFGFAKANNIGVKRARGHYICLVNSDVKILNNCFQTLISYLIEHDDVGMVAPRTLNADHSLQKAVWKFPSVKRTIFAALGIQYLFPTLGHEYGPINTTTEVDCLGGSFLLIPRNAIDQVGLLDEAFFFYGEDVDWCKRFKDAKWKIVLNPNAEIIHYGGVSYCGSPNAHGPIPLDYYLMQIKANLHYWKKHHGTIGQFFYWFMLLISNTLRFSVKSFISIFPIPSKVRLKSDVNLNKKILKSLLNLL